MSVLKYLERKDYYITLNTAMVLTSSNHYISLASFGFEVDVRDIKNFTALKAFKWLLGAPPTEYSVYLYINDNCLYENIA